MPSTKVTVMSRGKVKFIDDRDTIYMNLYNDGADWILVIDSETCSEKRKKTRKLELEEYTINGLVHINYLYGKTEIMCKTIELRKSC